MANRAIALVALALLAAPGTGKAGGDPLPSWRDNANKQRIIRFVADVSTPGAKTYVTPADRVAVFDDDGTLWPERPRAQGMFALERLRDEAPDHPEWKTQLPFAGALELGDKYMMEASDDAVMELLAASSAGLTQEDLRAEVREYFATARHPRFDVPYTRTVYQPMRELLGYLRANGFRCYVITSGSIDLVRALAADLYGLPGGDVVGSSVVTTLRDEDGRLVVRRLQTIHALDDGDMKPLSIDMHIGQRPIFAAGNVRSGGDISMLRYSQDQEPARGQKPGKGAGGAYPSLQVLVVHDDFEREYAYEEKDRASLNAADKRGWEVVSMRWDWLRIFPFDTTPLPPAQSVPAAESAASEPSSDPASDQAPATP